MSRVVVIGATGHIGSYLVPRLVRGGHEVIALSRGTREPYHPSAQWASVSRVTVDRDAEDEAGFLYSKVRSYASVSRAALAEMYRQMGDELVMSEDGLLKRGLVIRLLVLPNDIGAVRDSLEWIRNELGPRVAVSLMAQYYPTNVAGTNQRYALLSRRINESEWLRAVAALDELGMEEGWMQEYDGASYYYRPDFNDDDTPFRDIRDFELITS